VTDREVRVVYTKYDGSLHWHHRLTYLGEDEHGIWLGTGPGTASQRGNEPPILLPQPYVQLIPVGQWWTAAFNGEPSDTEIYCDISTPAQWHGDEVTMVDLDLDVLRLRTDHSADEQVLLVDADEFAEHQVRYSYPPDVVSAAEASAAWLQQAIKAGAEPFATVFHVWLAKVS
jgi:uncharacterized protein